MKKFLDRLMSALAVQTIFLFFYCFILYFTEFKDKFEIALILALISSLIVDKNNNNQPT